MRDRLHNYTKRTLGAGGSMNEAVSVYSSVSYPAGVRFVGEIFSGLASQMLE